MYLSDTIHSYYNFLLFLSVTQESVSHWIAVAWALALSHSVGLITAFSYLLTTSCFILFWSWTCCLGMLYKRSCICKKYNLLKPRWKLLPILTNSRCILALALTHSWRSEFYLYYSASNHCLTSSFSARSTVGLEIQRHSHGRDSSFLKCSGWCFLWTPSFDVAVPSSRVLSTSCHTECAEIIATGHSRIHVG